MHIATPAGKGDQGPGGFTPGLQQPPRPRSGPARAATDPAVKKKTGDIIKVVNLGDERVTIPAPRRVNQSYLTAAALFRFLLRGDRGDGSLAP